MEMKQLTAFVGVYEQGSMSRAALRLSVTQPSISVLIKKLEAELGVTLFERLAAGTLATPHAEAFYRHAQTILNQAEEARAALRGATDTLQGLLRVGLAPTVARGVLFRVLGDFLADHPKVEIRITEGMSIDLINWTLSGEFDLAIVTNPPEDRRLTIRRIAVEPMVLIAGARSGRENLAKVNLSMGDPLRIVLPFGRHQPVGALFRFLSSGTIPVKQILQTNSLTATLALVERTGWVTILSISAIADQFDRFVVQEIEEPAHDTEFFIVRPARGSLSAAARLFSRMIEEGFVQSLQQWNDVLARARPIV